MLTRNATGTPAYILDETDRPRLVRLCARLSGCADAAEDLAQETLLEAWRHLAQLEDASGYWPWLTAIARHVCRRWARRHRSAATHERPLGAGSDEAGRAEEPPAADADVALGLEREELITLLDRALARLPPATRAVLVARYVADWPQAASPPACA
jgi:RNA polymerase sigma factor (sigma-70 family)